MDIAFLEKLLTDLNELANKIYVEPLSQSATDKSIANMKEYLNLRKMDITKLQDDLTKAALSSLGRSQGHIFQTINSIIELLSKVLQKEVNILPPAVSYDESWEISKKNTKIFGGLNDSKTKIMVTLPSMGSDKSLISKLVQADIDIFRINTAHDNLEAWRGAAAEIIKEREQKGKNIKIYVDLAGPKIRTSKSQTTKSPIKIGSKKDEKIVELVKQSSGVTSGAYENEKPSIAVDDEFFRKTKEGDFVELMDIGGKKHYLEIFKKSKTRYSLKAKDKFFIDENSRIALFVGKKKFESKIYNYVQTPAEIRVFKGDKIILSSDMMSKKDFIDQDGEKYEAVVGCELKNIHSFVKVGDLVFIDDGKIETVIEELRGDKIVCKVINAKEGGSLIKEEKGINFPNSNIDVSALSEQDISILEEVCQFADLIGISFAQTKEDVEELIKRLKNINKTNISIVAKIETKKGVKNLPQILEKLIEYQNSGIMIARGDLAIEIGFENLAYMQEEILDLCASAHMPVILATQVLENKLKTNIPGRAEITDASYAQRADCVMLNKGEFVIDAVKTLKIVLKETSLLFKKNKLLLSQSTKWH